MGCPRLNTLLFLLFLGLVAVSWLVRPDFGKPNPDPTSDMAASVPYDSFSANPNFRFPGMATGAWGPTLREPASGTIVHGRLPLHFPAATEGALLAGERLTSPLAATDAVALERGAVVYTNNCFPCHGAMAKGDGPVTTRGFPPPPSIVTGKYLTYKDGQFFHIITYGMNNMPAYAKQILKDDRWRAILYLRTLQQKAVQEEEAARLAALKSKQNAASGTTALDASGTQSPGTDSEPAGGAPGGLPASEPGSLGAVPQPDQPDASDGPDSTAASEAPAIGGGDEPVVSPGTEPTPPPTGDPATPGSPASPTPDVQNPTPGGEGR